MNQTTLTQVIEAALALPLEDQRRLRERLEVQERRLNETRQREERFKSDEDRHKKIDQWLRENRLKYVGQWVALDEDRLISHGTDGRKVFEEAKAAGVKVPFLEHIVEEKYPFGGW